MASGKNVATIPAMGGEAGLNRYLAEIKKFPILAPEEEYMLAKRWTEHQDTDAAAKLVNSHLRLVAKIAMGYRGYGLPVSELISEGNIGLMQGVKKFEPDRGVTEDEVISMNRRMGHGGDTSLNAPLKSSEDGEGQWQDFLVSEAPLQDEVIADDEERRVRHELLVEAMES